MKFKTYITDKLKQTSTLSCVSWTFNDEIYCCTNDHQIIKYAAKTQECLTVSRLPEDFYPSDTHWLLRTAAGTNKGNEVLLIGSTDGRYIIFNKTARIERSVNAHEGPINSCRWSIDGTGLLTAGNDGVIKIWSRVGMLRSTVVQNEGPIHCARWSPNSQAIIYCQGSTINVKSMAANSKIVKWKAHDGLVFEISPCPNRDLIASAGEDCRYKIWDIQGTNIFTSSPDDYSITSVSYNTEGDLLAVGGFNLLKLCDATGWNHENSRFTSKHSGSLLNINWSVDGKQVAAGSSSGSMILGYVVERQATFKNAKVVMTSRKTMLFEDILTSVTDTLEFSERIVHWELAYGYLVAATSSQVHIFSEKYLNTPIIADGRNEIRMILMGKKYFLVIDGNGIFIYTYTGRLHLNPRFIGSQTQLNTLTKFTISLGIDYIAVKDSGDPTIIYMFDLLPGATRQNEPMSIKNKLPIEELALSKNGNHDNQYLTFIDASRDLYITQIQSGTNTKVQRIGTQVITGLWSVTSNMYVGLHDASYSIWCCPGEASSDPTLIALTTITFDTSEFGRNIALDTFTSNYVKFQSLGAAFTVPVKSAFNAIHNLVEDGMWSKALKLCRIFNDPILWGTLAAIASKQNQIEICEEAFSATIQIDKVNHLHFIHQLHKGEPLQMAEVSVLNGRITEAELLLVHNKQIKEAINLCMRMHSWDRALDIAQKHKQTVDLVDVVLSERNKYLSSLRKKEWLPSFLSYVSNFKPINDE